MPRNLLSSPYCRDKNSGITAENSGINSEISAAKQRKISLFFRLRLSFRRVSKRVRPYASLGTANGNIKRTIQEAG
jgi:hypothetical protein